MAPSGLQSDTPAPLSPRTLSSSLSVGHFSSVGYSQPFTTEENLSSHVSVHDIQALRSLAWKFRYVLNKDNMSVCHWWHMIYMHDHHNFFFYKTFVTKSPKGIFAMLVRYLTHLGNCDNCCMNGWSLYTDLQCTWPGVLFRGTGTAKQPLQLQWVKHTTHYTTHVHSSLRRVRQLCILHSTHVFIITHRWWGFW